MGNVVTAFRALLQSRREGGPRGVVERALQALEAAALRTIETFGTREVANTLHIMAKTRYRPWDQTLVPKLEGRAEALAGTFNAQDVANTLWAYATMGREPGAGVMRGLDGGGRDLDDVWRKITATQKAGRRVLLVLQDPKIENKKHTRTQEFFPRHQRYSG